jgi:hypothetical protein
LAEDLAGVLVVVPQDDSADACCRSAVSRKPGSSPAKIKLKLTEHYATIQKMQAKIQTKKQETIILPTVDY